MAFAGGLGADVTRLPGDLSVETMLFSESPTRFVLEAPPANVGALEELFAGLPVQRIGQTVKEPRLRIAGPDGAVVVDVFAPIRADWKKFDPGAPQTPKWP